MPIIKSAKKKMRQDKKRRERNLEYIKKYKKAIKEIKKEKDLNKISLLIKKAYSIIDKTLKRKIIKKNKAARLKSRITRFVNLIQKSKKKEKNDKN